MTVYRVEVSGPEIRSADEFALMLTSNDHYRTSDYVITVEKEMTCCLCDEAMKWEFSVRDEDGNEYCEDCWQP